VNTTTYYKALELLKRVSTPHGFLASAEATSNYQRVWARDGVICGLAALASGDKSLIATFEATINTLATYQHEIGTIPSNVLIKGNEVEISYGGLAGRVDAVSWFVIGVCQLAIYKNDIKIVEKYQIQIEKCLQLLNAWEYNNKDLVYVPLSGNWADEYITEGYVLYDQLLRLWALRSYNFFEKNELLAEKIVRVTQQIQANFLPHSNEEKFHERAYANFKFEAYLPCSFSPSGYQNQYDAFANALLILLDIGTENLHESICAYALKIAADTQLKLVPAFWPPIFETDADWNLLKDNCKYEFRNYPYEFHNGGSWPMVNGFVGLSFLKRNITLAAKLAEYLNEANAVDNYSFYENFNTQTQAPNGVAFCAWSAAATVLLEQAIQKKYTLFFN